MWRRRPPALAASKEPARLYTYHKLHAWDPRVVKGAPRVAFVDADAIYVRNASALLEIEPPSAFYLRDPCRPPNIPWHRWDPGIEIDGEPVPKARAYWNTGVVVYEPDATVARDLWRLYATGDFASFDPSRMSTGNGVGPRLANERRPTQASTPTSTSARATCFRPTTGGAGAGRGRTSSTPPGILGGTSARTRTSPTRPGSASSTRRSAARSRSSSTPASTSARPHAARGPGSWRSSSRRSTSARAARRPRRPRSGGPVPTRRRVVVGKACCHWQCVF